VKMAFKKYKLLYIHLRLEVFVHFMRFTCISMHVRSTNTKSNAILAVTTLKQCENVTDILVLIIL